MVTKFGNFRFSGHYREARFTQTKHHWWWKVRVTLIWNNVT